MTDDKENKPAEEIEPETPVTDDAADEAAVAEETAENIILDLTETQDEEEAGEEDEDPAADTDDRPPTYEELLSEVAALKDQLLRTLAETENVRRRTEREKADASKYAVSNFARSVLSVADNLKRALDSVSQEARDGDEDLNNLFIGIELTGNELDNVYEQFGIKPIEAMGKKFDHNFHQAMFELDAPDQPAGVVIQEMQRGYVIHDRLLRPAMVGVSKGGPKLADEPEESPASEEEAIEPAIEKVAEKSSSAYAKQSEAADQEADGAGPQLDKKF